MFLYHHWLELAIPTRIKIAQIFGIPKTGSTHVSNNTVQSDGFNIVDIENKLSVKNLQEYLNSNQIDHTFLWSLLIDIIEGRIKLEEKPIELQDATTSVDPIKPIKVPYTGKKRGRKPKNKNGETTTTE